MLVNQTKHAQIGRRDGISFFIPPKLRKLNLTQLHKWSKLILRSMT